MEVNMSEQSNNLLHVLYSAKEEEKCPNQQDSWFVQQNSQPSQHDDSDEQDDPQMQKQLKKENAQRRDQQRKKEGVSWQYFENIAEGRFKDLKKYYHNVDTNYLVLLGVLAKHRMVNLKTISGLKEGYIDFEYRTNRLVVKTTSQTQANEAIQKISDFIDGMYVLKLPFHGEKASHYSNFKKLKEYLRKDKIVMFGNWVQDSNNLFIGGQMKRAQLVTYCQKINNIRVQEIFLRSIRNTRSYRIIIDQILNMPDLQQQFIEFNQVNFLEIARRNKFKELKISLGMISKKDHSAYDYEHFFMQQLRKYDVLTFCCSPLEKYIEKPNIANVAIKLITDKKINKMYMYIIAKRQIFVSKRQEIYNEIAKIDQILGVRFFYFIHPSSNQFIFEKTTHYFFRYPTSKPYSITFAAKRREGHRFDWQEFYKQFIEVAQKTIKETPK